MREVGWILDVYVSKKHAVIWVKLESERAVRLTDSYRPDFYVALKDGSESGNIAETLSLHPSVYKVEVEEKYTSILERMKSKVIHVFTYAV
ncbi:MAG: DNA-directed polymerase [Thermoproteota archaeon]|nr:DNA-directed polymerase [Thermoproteota archaeon]